MKFKKMFTLFVCAVMSVTSIFTVGAVENDIAFIVENPDLGTITVMQEDVDRMQSVVAELMEAGAIIDPATVPQPAYGSETVVESYTTLDFATALAGADGVSSSKILLVKDAGRQAKTLAEETYNGSAAERAMIDSCRHFVWNFLSIKNTRIGSSAIQKFTKAYEWAHLSADELADEYDRQYDIMLENGEMDPHTAAFVATCAYFEILRDEKVDDCTSLTKFKTYVDTSSAMDFWNNATGRTYGAKSAYEYADSIEAYQDAYNAGDIIGSTSSISKTSTNYRTVYNNSSWWS